MPYDYSPSMCQPWSFCCSNDNSVISARLEWYSRSLWFERLIPTGAPAVPCHGLCWLVTNDWSAKKVRTIISLWLEMYCPLGPGGFYQRFVEMKKISELPETVNLRNVFFHLHSNIGWVIITRDFIYFGSQHMASYHTGGPSQPSFGNGTTTPSCAVSCW